MGEERTLILQMLADGKITPEEADQLLEAIEQGEAQAARAAATASTVTDRGRMEQIGESVDRVVSETMKGLDETMRDLEDRLERRQREFDGRNLQHKVEEKIRRSAERAVQEAQRMEERAERVARRAEEKIQRQVDRASRYANGKKFVMGIQIDREHVSETEHLTLPAEPGDCLELDNSLGDVFVQFYDGDQIELDVSKTVWGTDRADAQERAAAKSVHLVRQGSTVKVEVDRVTTVALFGIVWTKDAKFDYTLRLPHGTHLRIDNSVGDIRIEAGSKVGTWELNGKVGDIDIAVAPDASFRYTLKSAVGNLSGPNGHSSEGIGAKLDGRLGDGAGSVEATTKTGGVRVHY